MVYLQEKTSDWRKDIVGKRRPVIDRQRLGQWGTSDELWEQIEPLLPPPPPPDPLGRGRPRVPDREALDGILFVLRTGCQWKALDATGICSGSTAHSRFQKWVQAGVFHAFWRQGLLAYDELKGIDWSWLAMDGAMTKAPLGGEKKWPQSYRSVQMWGQAQRAV